MQPSRPNKFGLAALSVTALGALVTAGLAVPSAASAAPNAAAKKSQLGKHDHELLDAAIAKGSSTVTLLIAATPGRTSSVISGLQALGATISKSDSDVSYIRAVVPVGKADAAANLADIVAADLDEVIPLDQPEPAGTQAPTPQTPPGPSTPRANPYMPI